MLKQGTEQLPSSATDVMKTIESVSDQQEQLLAQLEDERLEIENDLRMCN